MTDTKHTGELATCDFCRASEVPVRRKYLYRENKEREIGDGFTITRYCHECGLKSENADTKHTDSVEASEKEYQRQLAIAISVGEKEPHISAFIGAWDMYDGLMNDCFMTSKDRAQMRKMLTTLQAHTSQQVEELKAEITDLKATCFTMDDVQQQVEEAVRKAKSRLLQDIMDMADSNDFVIARVSCTNIRKLAIEQNLINPNLTPNHQD